MVEAELGTSLRQLPRDPLTIIGIVAILAFEGVLVIGYAARPTVTITNPLILIYPFVWIDISIVAVYTTSLPQAANPRRYAGLAIAGSYLLLLSYFGGLVGPGENLVPLQVDWSLPPGYAPTLLYNGPLLQVVLEPYKVVGYLALTYLVYVTVLDTAEAAVSGVLGLFSCVSCTFPLIATVATSLFGSTSMVTTVALNQPYLLGTTVFVLSIILLWWRPSLTGIYE